MSAIAAPITERWAFTRGETRGVTLVVRMPPFKKWKPVITISPTIRQTRNHVTTKETKGSVKM